ncbi:hypothetical protein HDU81_001823, partial [Chytriomyces hyalinus]
MLHPPDSQSLYVAAMRHNEFWSSNTDLSAKRWRNLSIDHPLVSVDPLVPFGRAAKRVVSLPDKAID